MKPTWTDRLFVGWLAGALTLWSVTLAALWAVTFDLSGTGPWMALAACLLAVWATVRLPGAAARLFQRVLPSFKLADVLGLTGPGGMPVYAGPREVRAMMRLLAGAAAVTAGLGLLSTAALYAAGPLAAAVGRQFLLGPTAWAAVRLVVEFAGSLPLAAGIGAVFLVAVLIRGGSGRDVYAAAFREWLFGAAGGLAAAAVAWWAGADLLGVAMAACVAVLATGLVLVQRMSLTIRPRRTMEPIASLRHRGQQAAIAAAFGATALGLMAQLRILRDVMGVGPGGQALWGAGAIAILAWFLRAADHRSHLPGQAQALAAAIGAVAGLTMQCALAIGALAEGAEGGVCLALAASAQVPLSALAAVAISRQRRVFASSGGRARSYLSSAAGGAGVGILVYLAAGALSVLSVAALTAAVATMAVAVVRGIPAARRPGLPHRRPREWAGQVVWAGCGAALILTAGLTPLTVLRGLPPLSAGEWLSAAATGGAGGAGAWTYCPPTRQPSGRGRPAVPGGRDERVTAPVEEWVAGRAGSWWVVASTPTDRPANLPPGPGVSWSLADPTAWPDSVPPPSEGAWWGDFPDETARGAGRFDGVFLAPLRADHPEAWRCYQPQVLSRCWDRVHEGGLLILRTQAAAGREADALAVARGLADVAGSGWALMAISEAGIDMALVALRGGGRPPAVFVPPAQAAHGGQDDGVFLVPLERVCPPGTKVRPAWLSGCGWLRAGGVDRRMLLTHWRAVQATPSP